MELASYYKNIKILYEDPDILVCLKPAGTPVQSKSIRIPDMESLLKSYLHSPYLGVIHRLDQPVEGVTVFAKTPAAAGALSRQLTAGQFGKQYLAVVCGLPSSKEGTLGDYMLKDGRTNTSRICAKGTAGAKYAELSYRTLEEKEADPLPLSLLDIHLKTGRHHQIRVQLAHAGMPLLGDSKYNPDCTAEGSYAPVALCAYRLAFTHPRTKKQLQFEIMPQGPGFTPFFTEPASE